MKEIMGRLLQLTVSCDILGAKIRGIWLDFDLACNPTPSGEKGEK